MNWYCIHTRPQKEREVIHALEHLQLDTYFPRLRQLRRIRRVRRPITQPLFPRYVFCRFDPQFLLRAVRYTRDVLDVVSLGDRPVVVSDSLIHELRSWAGETLDLISSTPSLAPGDNVEIAEGPFQGLRAVILHETNDVGRVAVLLTLLSAGAQVTIPRAHLMKVS